jgi:CRISPR-associated protein Cas2
MVFVVISYDISDDGIRKKVANILLDHGVRVQYSVFECLVDAKTLDKLIDMLFFSNLLHYPLLFRKIEHVVGAECSDLVSEHFNSKMI